VAHYGVPICPKCAGFTERLTFATPEEYREFVRQLIGLVSQSRFSLLRGDCHLEDLLTPPWPTGDTIRMISNVGVAVAPFNSVPMFGTEETGGSLSLGQKGPTETVGCCNIPIALKIRR
jgi:hypothetical protein